MAGLETTGTHMTHVGEAQCKIGSSEYKNEHLTLKTQTILLLLTTPNNATTNLVLHPSRDFVVGSRTKKGTNVGDWRGVTLLLIYVLY